MSYCNETTFSISFAEAVELGSNVIPFKSDYTEADPYNDGALREQFHTLTKPTILPIETRKPWWVMRSAIQQSQRKYTLLIY